VILRPARRVGVWLATAMAHGISRRGDAPQARTAAETDLSDGLTGRCSFFNESVATPTWITHAPVDGVITRWRFRGGCCVADAANEHRVVFRIFRQGDRPGFEYVKVAVRTGAAYVLPAGGTLLASDVIEVPERLPIYAGQWPGLNTEWPLDLAGKAATNNNIRFMQPAPADEVPGQSTVGSPAEASASTLSNVVVSFNAVLEPDADHDGYGDESQDCSPADPTSQVGCTPPPPSFLPNPITLNGGRARVALAAAAKAGKRRLLGSAKFSVKPGKSAKIKVRITKAGRKLLGKRRRHSITVTLRPTGGKAISVRRTVTLPRR
jgi:hypothetical protein